MLYIPPLLFVGGAVVFCVFMWLYYVVVFDFLLLNTTNTKEFHNLLFFKSIVYSYSMLCVLIMLASICCRWWYDVFVTRYVWLDAENTSNERFTPQRSTAVRVMMKVTSCVCGGLKLSAKQESFLSYKIRERTSYRERNLERFNI